MKHELPKTYAPKAFEDRIYQNWSDKGYFTPDVQDNKPSFSVVIPPPNVTGQLHMGHALDETLQDILVRYKRMQGYSTLWVPGTDSCRYRDPDQGGRASAQKRGADAL